MDVNTIVVLNAASTPSVMHAQTEGPAAVGQCCSVPSLSLASTLQDFEPTWTLEIPGSQEYAPT